MGNDEVAVSYCTAEGDAVDATWQEVRAEAIVEGLPVRVPPAYRGQRNYPGLFWAASNQRTLVYESLLELDRLWLADFDRTVVAIATQPFQVTGSDGAALRSHVPDILLVHDDGRATLVDVKPTRLLDRRPVCAQFDWTRKLCRDKGWDYEIFSGADPVVLRNIRALALGRRPGRIDQSVLERARRTVGDGASTVGDVLAYMPDTCDEASWRVALAACLWSGHARIDLRVALTAHSVLTPSIRAAA